MAGELAQPYTPQEYAELVARGIDPGVPLLNEDRIEHALTREPQLCRGLECDRAPGEASLI